jgi:hypothetical protein
MKQATSKPITECQICSSKDMKSVLFVGFIPPVNTMPAVGSTPVEQEAYPLEMLRCGKCGLVQIGLEVDQNVLFPPSYPYLSGTTKILRENFADLYKEVNNVKPLAKTDFVVDIGSNDGTLLNNFYQGGHQVLGIEPSHASDIANKNGVRTWMCFFNQESAARAKKEFGTAKVITAANVFAHIGDVHKIVDGITDLLDEKGIFVSENHYLYSLVETVQYDTIYHEHLRYYSLRALMYLFDSHGLEVFRVKRIPTHGGSIRVFTARKGTYPIDASVNEALAAEDKAGITDGSALKTFSKRVSQSKIGLYSLIDPIKKAGQKIYGIGAPSRASTLINYVGLDDSVLDSVMEVASSHKVQKYIPGTRIPVLAEEKLFQDQPEYAMLLSWHIADELIGNLKKKGYKGKFIVPLPEPRIVE